MLMGLNIKNAEVERLAAEAAKKFGETKTEAIRVALRQRLALPPPEFDVDKRRRDAMRVLEAQIWPKVPPDMLGKRISKKEWEELLGFGPDGI